MPSEASHEIASSLPILRCFFETPLIPAKLPMLGQGPVKMVAYYSITSIDWRKIEFASKGYLRTGVFASGVGRPALVHQALFHDDGISLAILKNRLKRVKSRRPWKIRHLDGATERH